jgi:uncharacterized Tic20 family protein
MKLSNKFSWLWAFLLTATFFLGCASGPTEIHTVLPGGETPLTCHKVIKATDRWFDNQEKEVLQRPDYLKATHAIYFDWSCVTKDIALINIQIDLVYYQSIPTEDDKILICASLKLQVRNSLNPEGTLDVDHTRMEILKLELCDLEDL